METIRNLFVILVFSLPGVVLAHSETGAGWMVTATAEQGGLIDQRLRIAGVRNEAVGEAYGFQIKWSMQPPQPYVPGKWFFSCQVAMKQVFGNGCRNLGLR